MNVKNFERKDNSKAEITVEFTAVEFEKALNDAFPIQSGIMTTVQEG